MNPTLTTGPGGLRVRAGGLGCALVLVLAMSQASCGQAQSPAAATPASASDPVANEPAADLPPLPRSSIAAVVQHRSELALTDDQVRELELLDLEREKANATVRDEAERKRQQARDAKAASPSGGAPAGGRGGGGSGMRGGGMGGGRGGGMRGGGMGGHGPRPAAGGAASAPDPEVAVQDQMDANDTKAYLDAEALLEEQQRERAREIASDFREKLYERRELMRGRSSSTK